MGSPWKKLSEKIVYDNPWIQVTEHDVINPAGGKGIYGKVHFKNVAIGVIPLDESNNTWLVGQHRYTLNEFSWEIPEGGGPIGQDMLESAKRELREETGYTAEKWELILRMHNSNSVSDEEAQIYLAEVLTAGENDLEDTESDLRVKKVHLSEAIKMVENGEITDAMSVAGLLKVARMKGF